MHIHIIGCRVLTRELSALIPSCKNTIAISWLPQGLHDTPAILHSEIEEELDRIYDQIDRRLLRVVPDYIVLGYGLCSNSTVGIEATRIPLVVPRIEDCIGLFLGSEDRYLEMFNDYPGTFWLNTDWVENLPDVQEDYYEKLHAKYMEEYDDEDMADYLVESAKSCTSSYKQVGFINSDSHDNTAAQTVAKNWAERSGLGYKEFEGNSSMFKKIVEGDFNEKDFLIVPPGYKVEYTNGPERVIAVPGAGA